MRAEMEKMGEGTNATGYFRKIGMKFKGLLVRQPLSHISIDNCIKKNFIVRWDRCPKDWAKV